MATRPAKKTPRPPTRNHRATPRGRPCSVCRHPERNAIDRALVTGEPDTIVSAKFRELSDDAVRRHRESHLPQRLAKAHAVAEVAQADALLEQVRTLHRRALAILDQAESAGDLRSALGGIREARGCLELLGRLEGELPSPTVNLIVSAQWIQLRGLILQVLRAHPKAQQDVAAALQSYDVAG
jgi:hypothetical protein